MLFGNWSVLFLTACNKVMLKLMNIRFCPKIMRKLKHFGQILHGNTVKYGYKDVKCFYVAKSRNALNFWKLTHYVSKSAYSAL